MLWCIMYLFVFILVANHLISPPTAEAVFVLICHTKLPETIERLINLLKLKDWSLDYHLYYDLFCTVSESCIN